ncbi:hypothetical protein PPTG_22452 [Phytophthora nicotianae INRA-310]|uniref:Uncharacterized protein n=2 Tax=Phytophthora nicotianae TaxID=4792 RepID=W2QGX5_PHYN3|nr:hypothetical protein PPTG_22452 [Phytophthora nicotianae INRA-310]ETN12121.1 hypothetical protein PPTG_22452 [Phytophthora nicotianae INRA-310]ETO80742.1 hypothetical protein F444_04823 [Phytophthora nicotianae P1976]
MMDSTSKCRFQQERSLWFALSRLCAKAETKKKESMTAPLRHLRRT